MRLRKKTEIIENKAKQHHLEIQRKELSENSVLIFDIILSVLFRVCRPLSLVQIYG